jgi:hypothetical protein
VKIPAVAKVKNARKVVKVDYKKHFYCGWAFVSKKKKYIFSPLKQSINRSKAGSNDSKHVLL